MGLMRTGPWIAGLAALWAHVATAQQITGASYTDPTTRYAHGVLGDAIEWGALRLEVSDGTGRIGNNWSHPDSLTSATNCH